ncbi:MAG: hypothetical protein PHR77_15935 [Kiritimatiellae bacterium]|nr:hypothetical protein [Kiritimatiellia bacterium]MDD5520651.1 hypothetical protein [Kiritimatiellia bacterium]
MTGKIPTFLCPSDPSGLPSYSTDGKTRVLSYGGNLYAGQGCNSSLFSVVNCSDIRYPAEMFLMCDADSFFVDGIGMTAVDYRHKGGVNLVFFDGHVAFRKEAMKSYYEDAKPWWPDGVAH